MYTLERVPSENTCVHSAVLAAYDKGNRCCVQLLWLRKKRVTFDIALLPAE